MRWYASRREYKCANPSLRGTTNELLSLGVSKFASLPILPPRFAPVVNRDTLIDRMLPPEHESTPSYTRADNNQGIADVVPGDSLLGDVQHVPGPLIPIPPEPPPSSPDAAVSVVGVAPPPSRPEDSGGGFPSGKDPPSQNSSETGDAVRVVSFQRFGSTTRLTVHLALDVTLGTDAERDRVAERFAEYVLTRMPGQLHVWLRWSDLGLLSLCLKVVSSTLRFFFAEPMLTLPSILRVYPNAIAFSARSCISLFYRRCLRIGTAVLILYCVGTSLSWNTGY